jgi:hypothetical protein
VTVGEAAASKSVPVRCAGIRPKAIGRARLRQRRGRTEHGNSSSDKTTETGRMGQGPTWRVHGLRQRRGRVLVSPDHAAVAVEEPGRSPVAARMLRLGRAELYHIARWNARIGRLCFGLAHDADELRLVPAQSVLSIRAAASGRANHVCRCAKAMGDDKSGHQLRRGQTAGARSIADVLFPARHGQNTNQRGSPLRFDARCQMPQLRRCGGASASACRSLSPMQNRIPAILYSAPLSAVDRHRRSPGWRRHSPVRPFWWPPHQRCCAPPSITTPTIITRFITLQTLHRRQLRPSSASRRSSD